MRKRRRTPSGARRKSARGLTDEREAHGKPRAKLMARRRGRVAGSGSESSRRPNDLPCGVPEHRRSRTLGEKFDKPGFRSANGFRVRCRVELLGGDRQAARASPVNGAFKVEHSHPDARAICLPNGFA